MYSTGTRGRRHVRDLEHRNFSSYTQPMTPCRQPSFVLAHRAHAALPRACRCACQTPPLSPGAWSFTAIWAGRAAHRAAVRDGDAHFPGAGPRGHGAARGLEGGASDVALLGVLHVLVAVVHGHVPEPDHVHRRQPCIHQLRSQYPALQADLPKGPSSLHHCHASFTSNAQGWDRKALAMAEDGVILLQSERSDCPALRMLTCCKDGSHSAYQLEDAQIYKRDLRCSAIATLFSGNT